MPERSSDAMHLVKEQAATIAQAIIEQAANRAVHGGERARGAAERAKDTAGKKTSRLHIRKHQDDAMSNMREIALSAAASALDLWQAARERAEELAEAAEDEVAEPAARLVERAERRTRHVADEVAGRAKLVSRGVVEHTSELTDRAKEVAGSVTDHTDDLTGRAKESAKSVALRADDVTVRAKDATKSAAESTVSTGRDTGATMLWSAAAAGVVYFVLMDKERREQLLRVVDAIVEQTREIIRDFQGYDEQFGQ